MSKTIWVIIFQDFKILISDTATILAEIFFEGWDISYLKVTSIGMFQVKTQFWVSPSQITHFEPSHLKIVFLCISYEYRYSRASANTGHERVIFTMIARESVAIFGSGIFKHPLVRLFVIVIRVEFWVLYQSKTQFSGL